MRWSFRAGAQVAGILLPYRRVYIVRIGWKFANFNDGFNWSVRSRWEKFTIFEMLANLQFAKSACFVNESDQSIWDY